VTDQALKYGSTDSGFPSHCTIRGRSNAALPTNLELAMTIARYLFRQTLIALAAVALLTAAPVAARADAALDEGVEKLCVKITEFLKEKNQSKLNVGDFIAPPKLKSSSGPGISQMLATAFQKQGITIAEGGMQLMGTFDLRDEKDAPDADFESVVLRIRAQVLDNDDEVQKVFSISVFGDAALQLAGGSVDLTDHAFPGDREKTKRESLTNPQAAIVGNETRASAESLFGVEVHRSAGGNLSPLTPVIENGRSFVSLAKGDEYVIRLINRAPFEAAVNLTIDGLSMYTFAEDNTGATQVLVPPNSFVEIPGWYCTTSLTKAFLITGYPESAAGQRGVTSGVGTITAGFSAAWEVGKDPPDDEPLFSRSGDGDIATGLGRPIEKKYVKVERNIGQLRAVVSVRYKR
jgi:hypothetical protein